MTVSLRIIVRNQNKCSNKWNINMMTLRYNNKLNNYFLMCLLIFFFDSLVV